jgi:hypothetical protein
MLCLRTVASGVPYPLLDLHRFPGTSTAPADTERVPEFVRNDEIKSGPSGTLFPREVGEVDLNVIPSVRICLPDAAEAVSTRFDHNCSCPAVEEAVESAVVESSLFVAVLSSELQCCHCTLESGAQFVGPLTAEFYRKSEWIRIIHWIPACKPISIQPPRQPDGVRLGELIPWRL